MRPRWLVTNNLSSVGTFQIDTAVVMNLGVAIALLVAQACQTSTAIVFGGPRQRVWQQFAKL